MRRTKEDTIVPMPTITSKDAGPSLSLRLHGAYAMTPASLRALTSTMIDFAGPPLAPPTIKVLRADAETEELQDIEEVLKDRNPKVGSISTVMIFCVGRDRRCSAAISACGIKGKNAIILDAHAGSADALSKLETAFQRARKWIDAIRTRVERVPRGWRTAAKVLMVSIWILALSTLLYDGYRQTRWKEQASKLLNEADNFAKEATMPPTLAEKTEELRSMVNKAPPVQWGRLLLWIVGGGVVGYAGNRFFTYGFPRVEYLIGEGVERSNIRKAIVSLVVVTVVGSWIVVPLIRSALF